MVYEKPEGVPILLHNPDPDVIAQRRRQHRAGVWKSRSQVGASALGTLALAVGAWVTWAQDPMISALMLMGAALLGLSAISHFLGSPGAFGSHHRNDPSVCWMHMYDGVPPGPYELPDVHEHPF